MRRSGGLEVGFCDSAGRGFFRTQPSEQIERWMDIHDNGTHLMIPWVPARQACGMNVSEYFVDVHTSTPMHVE